MNTRKPAFTFALALAVPLANADAPLPPPERIVVCSLSGMACADSDPISNSTVVTQRPNADTRWAIKGWHRWLFVADDGKSVAVAFGGMNLVPAESDLQLEVLHFYNQGNLVRSIRLADLYSDRSQLTRTVSHLEWVRSIRVNHANQLVLELVSGRRVAFAMSSGEQQAQALDGAYPTVKGAGLRLAT